MKIALRLAGIDLREIEASSASSPAAEAAGWARMIGKLIPGVRVLGGRGAAFPVRPVLGAGKAGSPNRLAWQDCFSGGMEPCQNFGHDVPCCGNLVGGWACGK